MDHNEIPEKIKLAKFDYTDGNYKNETIDENDSEQIPEISSEFSKRSIVFGTKRYLTIVSLY